MLNVTPLPTRLPHSKQIKPHSFYLNGNFRQSPMKRPNLHGIPKLIYYVDLDKGRTLIDKSRPIGAMQKDFYEKYLRMIDVTIHCSQPNRSGLSVVSYSGQMID